MAEKLKGLLDRANSVLGGLLGDFPQGFNAGAVAGVAGYPGDIAYMLDTAGRALTGQHTQPAAQDFPGTTEYLAAKAGYPVPPSFSGQLGAAVGGILTPGPGDLAKFAPVLSAIPFWHGSPHKYDAVDLSKIGTGEGAQAYGHGYYGAEAKETAQQYASVLSDAKRPEYIRNLAGMKGEVSDLEMLKAIISGESPWPNNQHGKPVSREFIERQIAERQDSINKLVESQNRLSGLNSLYRGEYRWPDPAKEAATPLTEADLLDWDKPLSEQSERVKSILRKLDIAPDESVFPHWTGQQLYESEVRAGTDFDGLKKVDSRKYVSDQLNKSGIPGIRYLDQMSRGAGEGTRNYVFFDQEGIKLLERNGEPLKAAEDFASRRAGKAKPYKQATGAQ